MRVSLKSWNELSHPTSRPATTSAGSHLARRVLDIDNAADRVEMTLLRLYRASGAYSAAAEQYGHYASAMRDQLGIEPPPLESL